MFADGRTGRVFGIARCKVVDTIKHIIQPSATSLSGFHQVALRFGSEQTPTAGPQRIF
jgi:hypothetical protein